MKSISVSDVISILSYKKFKINFNDFDIFCIDTMLNKIPSKKEFCYKLKSEKILLESQKTVLERMMSISTLLIAFVSLLFNEFFLKAKLFMVIMIAVCFCLIVIQYFIVLSCQKKILIIEWLINRLNEKIKN